jgi:hypothetical protein
MIFHVRAGEVFMSLKRIRQMNITDCRQLQRGGLNEGKKKFSAVDSCRDDCLGFIGRSRD